MPSKSSDLGVNESGHRVMLRDPSSFVYDVFLLLCFRVQSNISNVDRGLARIVIWLS